MKKRLTTARKKGTAYSPFYGAIPGAKPIAPRPKPRSRSRKGTLAGPYYPASEGLNTMSEPGALWPVVIPDSMDNEMNVALTKLKEACGGDVEQFVQQRCGYESHQQLGDALMAEQVDAVALAIYNMEVRKEGIIIADQTGIGKGRIGSAIIRYAIKQGIIPIFITEKPGLFSDIYRDMIDTFSGDFVPFIFNERGEKSDVKDKSGKIIYKSAPPAKHKQIIAALSSYGPEETITNIGNDERGNPYSLALATYSQFNKGFDWTQEQTETSKGSGKMRTFANLSPKCKALANLAKNNIVILDESHNASGDSNTGAYMGQVLGSCKGVTFMSATFAKRPDNMVVYARKTVLTESGLPGPSLVQAIKSGGVALQEIISSQLVQAGQLLRRERPYKGVEVNWITLSQQEAVHKMRSDEMMRILRQCIDFQKEFVNEWIRQNNEEIANDLGIKTSKAQGTDEAGAGNNPMFSRVFLMVYQMLFAIKAEAVAQHAIKRLQEGKKVLITFQSTMGAFLDGLSKESGGDVDGDGDDDDSGEDEGFEMKENTTVQATFDVVLQRVLQMTLKIKEVDEGGIKTTRLLDLDELPNAAKAQYYAILNQIKAISTDVCISPIDLIVKIIEQAGYPVAEVTARKLKLDLDATNTRGTVRKREELTTNDAFRQFNENKVDVLLLNQAGSTGASAHAVPNDLVPASEVKQRVMIIHQASLDINVEVQKRGRVFRTGMILPPIYDYLTSAIPAEQRLMMMLKRKLKSLDSLTTADQDTSSELMDKDMPDFLNQYGDFQSCYYLLDNPGLDKRLGGCIEKFKAKVTTDPYDGSTIPKDVPVDFAQKVTGRVAILDTRQQADFYKEVSARYEAHIKYLDDIGQNALKQRDLDLRAITVTRNPILVGQGGRSAFGTSVFREYCTVRKTSKPYQWGEVSGRIVDKLEGSTPEALQDEMVAKVVAFYDARKGGKMSPEEWAAKIEKEMVRRKVPADLKSTNPDGYEAMMELITTEIQIGLDAAKDRNANDKARMTQVAKAFKVGYGCSVPNPDLAAWAIQDDFLAGVFLGFTVDENRPNPYAMSAVMLNFAVASPQQSMMLPCSDTMGKAAIQAATFRDKHFPGQLRQNDWERLIYRENEETEKRYILTGNVLLALGAPELAEFKKPLVTYTDFDGNRLKGILMGREYSKFMLPGGEGGRTANFISQGLRSKGLVKRLAGLFADNLGYGKQPMRLEMRGGGGETLLTITNSGGYNYSAFNLQLGWNDQKHQNDAKKFLKYGNLMVAIGKANEFTKVRGRAWDNAQRYTAEYVPIERLERVMNALADLGVSVALTKSMLDQYPDLMPENRAGEDDAWPQPAGLLPTRSVRPKYKNNAPAPAPAPAPDADAALVKKKKLAAARLRLAAAAALAMRDKAGLSGTRRQPARRGAIGHPNIKTYLR